MAKSLHRSEYLLPFCRSLLMRYRTTNRVSFSFTIAGLLTLRDNQLFRGFRTHET